MYTTFQNINTTTIDFDSLVGKYLCFLTKGTEHLKMTTGHYVTNCNYIYKVLKNTNCFMIVESTFSNGQVTQTKLNKESFEKYFFQGDYVISETKPVWDTEVGTYTIELPNYIFKSTTDTSKSFTTDEINDLLTQEFLGTTKTYSDVQNCIETLFDIIMKRHFDYVSIGRSYFQDTNHIHLGINIQTGHKYLSHFGEIEVRSYRNKINFIQFTPFDWIHRYTGFDGYIWSSLEDIIVKYLTDNKTYIDTL